MYHFFFNDTATTEIYTLSLHDALPIFAGITFCLHLWWGELFPCSALDVVLKFAHNGISLEGTSFDLEADAIRSEEHTSELQSLAYLVCRLLLEKKKQNEHSPVVMHQSP